MRATVLLTAITRMRAMLFGPILAYRLPGPGVYQDEGISLRVQEGAFPSIAGITLDAKFFPEIEAADLGIVHDIVLAPLHQDLAGINDVGPVREV